MWTCRFVTITTAMLLATAAQAGWTIRKGGELGTLVSATTPAGDEFFLFCSRTGPGFGLVARVSTSPGGPSDLTRVPITVAIDDKPAVALTVEGFDGAWVTPEAVPTLAAALPTATVVTVTIADSHAAGFEAPRQVFVPGGGFSSALSKAGFPPRCRPK